MAEVDSQFYNTADYADSSVGAPNSLVGYLGGIRLTESGHLVGDYRVAPR